MTLAVGLFTSENYSIFATSVIKKSIELYEYKFVNINIKTKDPFISFIMRMQRAINDFNYIKYDAYNSLKSVNYYVKHAGFLFYLA